MSQTTYNFNPAAGRAGLVAEMNDWTRIISKLASGSVQVGLLCAPGTDSMNVPSLTGATAKAANPGQVKAWPASGTITDNPLLGSEWAGIPIYDASRPPYDSSDQYADKDYVPVLRQGLIWVPTEGAVTQWNDVYVRCTTNGGNSTMGKFADGAGTGLCKLTNARWMLTTSGAGLSMLELRPQ